ncbi:MAG TPA: tRNA (adenosine(37)-N6)-dimethylallyltransferase MiaA [Elainellaceae cyanobacterium]
MSVLIVICGPTATGKSGLAIALAQRLSAAILSADSRQVYREFNIGTAKPSIEEREQIPHYLIDICDPTETFTLADYQHRAQALIRQFHHRISNESVIVSSVPRRYLPDSQIPFLVGGTGLYIKSIVRGLKIPHVEPQPELRSQLSALGQVQCYAMLQQVDPDSATKVHPHDQVRTLRSLEVFYVTGVPMSAQQGEDPPAYPILQLGLDCVDAEGLARRIEQRTDGMIEIGFVDEVHTLCQKYGANLPLLNTLGYQEVRQYLTGDISLQEAKILTVRHTRQFAKRQRTWFRADSTIEWFDCDRPDLVDRVWNRIQEFLSNRQCTENMS